MSTQLLWDGLKAMVLGMGIVYIFLIIMIWIMKLTSKFLAPYAGFLEPKKNTSKPVRTPAPKNVSDADLANAAVAAVRMYRSGNYDSRPVSLAVPLNGEQLQVSVMPGNAPAQSAPAPTHAATTTAADGATREIKSPLPGTIVKIETAVGSTVAAGEVIAVIEAMKMETEIRAEVAGTIIEITAAAKDIVAAGDTILVLKENK
ncbi:MAG: OadG family transporter subunit [Victivallaceae bacterium]|nr:OadG family transporter subunit [Victivallaceae bacterium]